MQKLSDDVDPGIVKLLSRDKIAYYSCRVFSLDVSIVTAQQSRYLRFLVLKSLLSLVGTSVPTGLSVSLNIIIPDV